MKDAEARRFPTTALVTGLAGLAALLWAYADSIAVMAREWSADPQYQHGFVVPLFSIGLFAYGCYRFGGGSLRPSFWGIPILATGLLIRHAAGLFYMEWFDQLSLVVCVTGLVVLAAGLPALRWAWPACGFLVLMVPLPDTLEDAMRNPLRRVGTVASTYVMQTIGLPAYSEGTVIVVDDVRIGVVEACSGLRMLMTFLALTVAFAILVRRPLWQRAVIVLSTLPIALFSNIVRITATGILHALGYSSFAEKFFHDFAGYAMMLLGLGLLWLLTAILDRLVVVEAPTLSGGFGLPGLAADAGRGRKATPVV